MGVNYKVVWRKHKIDSDKEVINLTHKLMLHGHKIKCTMLRYIHKKKKKKHQQKVELIIFIIRKK